MNKLVYAELSPILYDWIQSRGVRLEAANQTTPDVFSYMTRGCFIYFEIYAPGESFNYYGNQVISEWSLFVWGQFSQGHKSFYGPYAISDPEFFNKLKKVIDLIPPEKGKSDV